MQIHLPLNTLDELLQLEQLRDRFQSEIRHRRTPGLDRLTPDQFSIRLEEQLGVIHRKALSGTYRFTPYLEQLRPKGRGRAPRALSLPTIRDKLLLAQLREGLHHHFPNAVDRQLPNAHVRKLINALQNHPRSSVVRADISSFYDSIQHERLAALTDEGWRDSRAARLIRRAITNPTVPAMSPRSANSTPTTRGVPQGLAISNILANAYLQEIDTFFSQAATYYARFVDDIVVLWPHTSSVEALRLLERKLSDIGLRINTDKTQCSQATDQLDFLGYQISPTKVTVRQASVNRFLAGIAAQFTGLRRKSASGQGLTEPEWNRFFLDVNERITGAISEKRQYGWLFYFLEMNDHDLLHSMDRAIRSMAVRVGTPSQQRLKRLSRTLFEARHNRRGGYIHSYDQYTTQDDMRTFLLQFAYSTEDELAQLSDEEVSSRFLSIRSTRTSLLERDVGVTS